MKVHETIAEIIDLAAGETGTVATLLRKCLVLANSLKNEPLKVWAEKELIGYDPEDPAIPEYRKIAAPARGLFLGPYNEQLHDQPIASLILRKEHRHFAEEAVLRQPIASYEGVKTDSRLDWPANIVGLYERSFFVECQYALNRAWQVVPASLLIGLIDSIKTRVLRFALELKDDLGAVHDDIEKLSNEQVTHNFTIHIHGGNNVVGSTAFSQTNTPKRE